MARLEVASGKAVNEAIKWYEVINDWFKSFGIVTGGLAASAADWVFGAVTMAVLLSKYQGWDNSWAKWVVGGIFSMALWGIQIILWQLVLSGRIAEISNNRRYTFWMNVGVFFIITLMKFGDDVSDLFGVYWLMRDNPMKDVFDANLYLVLLSTVLFLAWVVCGFSEVFMSLSINLLKNGKQEQNNQNRNNQQNQKPLFQQNQKNQKGSERRHELENRYRPTPNSSSRPLYQEPTYHPKPMFSDDEGLGKLAKELMDSKSKGKHFLDE